MVEELTDDEIEIVNLLSEAWNRFLLLPAVHSDEVTEFRHILHNLQRVMIARPGIRELARMAGPYPPPSRTNL